VGRLLKEADLKPHQSRYWLTPPAEDPHLEEKVQDICQVYGAVLARAKAGERTLSTDELSGIQALERAAPNLPLAPGKVERREFEHLRHGTQTLIANLDVASGRIVATSCGDTRTEVDFAGHIEQTLATDPRASWWHFVVDCLNIHMSESLVKLVTRREGLQENTLGVKGKEGILRSKQTRATFLSDPQTFLLAEPNWNLV
jgi:hypothetical protein